MDHRSESPMIRDESFTKTVWTYHGPGWKIIS